MLPAPPSLPLPLRALPPLPPLPPAPYIFPLEPISNSRSQFEPHPPLLTATLFVEPHSDPNVLLIFTITLVLSVLLGLALY